MFRNNTERPLPPQYCLYYLPYNVHASVVRPMKELVRFQKVFLDPGEKKDVDFFIDQEEFSYYGKNMETVSSGMKLRISIGNSSDHLVSENIIQA